MPIGSDTIDFSGLYLQCAGVINDAGEAISGAGDPSDFVADVAAPTAYSAHASGAVAVTSNAATDLDTTAAALETLRDEVALIVTDLAAIKDILIAQGLMDAA